MTDQRRVQQLALEFAAGIRDSLSLEEVDMVNRINAKAATADHCATHDFCDANEVMLEAFQRAFGDEPALDSDADVDLINRAWSAARARGFRM